MIWRRHFESEDSTRVLLVLSIIGIIFAIYGKSFLLFWIALLLGLSTYISTKYIDSITKKFQYDNQKNIIRMFPDEELQWKLNLTNHSRWPIFHSHLRFLLNNEVSLLEMKSTDERKNANEYTLPLTFHPYEEKKLFLQVKGNRRGVAKLVSIEARMFDMLNLASAKLMGNRLVQTEFIIYPNLLSVKGVEDLIIYRQGNRAVPSSLFEDQTLVVGSRDYQLGDSFQRIHWKASARMEEMQTKLYERTVTQSWTILLNVILDSDDIARFGEQELLERQISYTAFLCQFAVQHHIPFELFVNIKTMGRIPYLHLEKGEGKTHLIKALELLARLNINSVKVPMFRILGLFKKEQMDSTVFIIVGDDEKDDRTYDQWRKQGIELHKIYIDEHSAKLERLEMRRSIS